LVKQLLSHRLALIGGKNYILPISIYRLGKKTAQSVNFRPLCSCKRNNSG
jgi:hypothetical protein